jgi:ribonuclease HI
MALRSRLLQWNCRSIISKKSDLLFLIKKYDPFVISLSETWLKTESCFKISGYSCLREDRSDGHGGVAILVKNSFHFTYHPISSHSNDYSIIAAIVNNICIVSVYIPHPTLALLRELRNILISLPKPYIIVGDFNCHHQTWGCSNSNELGDEILDIVDCLNLCILNSGAPTRRPAPYENASAIDLSICTPSIASSLLWEVLPSTYGSDHYPILLSFPFKNKPLPKRMPRLKYTLNNNSHWNAFKNKLDEKIHTLPLVLQTQISHCSEAFSKILTETADEVFPIKKSSGGYIPSPPWWDSECSAAVKNRKEKELLYNSNMSVDNYDNLILAMKNTKKLLKKKKVDSWRAFCASICPNSHSSEVWRKLRRFKGAFVDDNAFNIESTVADLFLDKLAPSFVPLLPKTIEQSSCNDEYEFLDNLFTLSELKSVLSYVKDSAPGLDGVPYSFLTHSSDQIQKYYLDLVNISFLTGYIPTPWKTQLVLPLHKPNKPKNNPNSFRPIALSSVLIKILEHLVKNRLEWFIETNKLLPNSQFGFRKNKSTSDCVGLLVSDILLAYSQNKFVASCFIDINSAYDNVNISLLLDKLVHLGVPARLCNIISGIFGERIIKLDLDSETLYRTVWKGLPQGSVLSPLLFNIYTYDYESHLVGPISIIQYADDIVLYCSDISASNACSVINYNLKILKIYLDSNGLDLSVSKTQAVLFSTRKKKININLVYNNCNILLSDEAKYLGVILDRKLTGRAHCNYIKNRCERSLNILRCLAGVWWGSHPFYLKLIYNATIRSVLDYCSYFLLPGTAIETLNTIQNKALRIILGAMKTSPIIAMQVESVDPPLHLRRQYLADRFIFRCMQYSNHPIIPKLSSLYDKMQSSPYLRNKPTPNIINSYLKFLSISSLTHRLTDFPLYSLKYGALILNPEVFLESGINKSYFSASHEFNSLIDERWSTGWHFIYTDASKPSTSSCVGIGVYHHQFKIIQKIKLPPESSVFTGEVYGLYKAVEYVHLMKLNKCVIITDSKSSLQALTKSPFKCKNIFPIVFHIRSMLLKCYNKGLIINFVWVPSHCGIYGNEKADQLAVDAVTSGDVFPYKNYVHDLLSLPNKYLLQSWEFFCFWGSLEKGSHFFSIQSEIPRKPWFHKSDFDRRQSSILTRMRLGHTCAPNHLFRFKIIDSQSCECGFEVADLEHIFFACPRYDRTLFMKSLVTHNIPLPINIPSLLTFSNVYNTIASFITKNNINI